MAGSKVRLPRADFVFFCRYFAQVAEMERHFRLSPDDIALINPKHADYADLSHTN